MERCQQPLLLLWLTIVVATNTLRNTSETVEIDTLVMTNKSLKVIPLSDNSSSVTKLVIEENLITLNEADQVALASYPTLVELHLDGNLVTAIPANYFSVVPKLRVLSLSRNNISSLDPNAFSGLDILAELDLSHNLLTSLPPPLFRGLSHLQVLNLQENPWNCSCPLLISIQEVKAENVNTGGPQVTCASPEKQAGNDLLNATAVCYPQQTPEPVNSQGSWGSSTLMKTTVLPDQTPVVGNTWKFTACIAALALTTFMLIVLAIKGPSWYKLYHNYRHRRLDQEKDEEHVVSTCFSEMGRNLNQQTFTFNQGDGQVVEEEEEDGYFEDPYIKREEGHTGERDFPDP